MNVVILVQKLGDLLYVTNTNLSLVCTCALHDLQEIT